MGVPPQRSGSNNSTLLIVLLILFVGLPLLAIGGCTVGAILLADTAGDVLDDVVTDFSDGVVSTDPASCRVDGLDSDGDYEVYASVTNRSGEASSYRVEYRLSGPDGSVIGSDYGVIGDVAAGATEEQYTYNVVSGSADPSTVTCTVDKVLRVPERP